MAQLQRPPFFRHAIHITTRHVRDEDEGFVVRGNSLAFIQNSICNLTFHIILNTLSQWLNLIGGSGDVFSWWNEDSPLENKFISRPNCFGLHQGHYQTPVCVWINKTKNYITEEKILINQSWVHTLTGFFTMCTCFYLISSSNPNNIQWGL